MKLDRAYFDLLKRALLGILALDDTQIVCMDSDGTGPVSDAAMRKALEDGDGFLPGADTLLGWTRLTQLHEAVRTALTDRIPGDVLAAGVWRGGSVALLRAALNFYGARDRQVVAADSYRGLPEQKHPADLAMRIEDCDRLAVPSKYVASLLRRYGVGEGVCLLEGWYRNTLPTLSGRHWSLIHVDADFYESTTDVLTHCYDNLSPGGFLVVDDYGAWYACRRAVDDFRRRHAITEPITEVDKTAIYWRKS